MKWYGQGSLTEKVLCEQKLKRGEGIGHPDMWGRSPHVMETAYAKALRQVTASPVWLVAVTPAALPYRVWPPQTTLSSVSFKCLPQKKGSSPSQS